MMGTPNCSKWIYPYLDLLTTGAICRVYCFLGIYHNLQLGPHPPLTVHSLIYNKLRRISLHHQQKIVSHGPTFNSKSLF